MPNYDFKQLSPHDFEQLTRDLMITASEKLKHMLPPFAGIAQKAPSFRTVMQSADSEAVLCRGTTA